jgi:hypothetical protein
MLQQLMAQHQSGSELPLPDYVRVHRMLVYAIECKTAN